MPVELSNINKSDTERSNSIPLESKITGFLLKPQNNTPSKVLPQTVLTLSGKLLIFDKLTNTLVPSR
jgi:hypothetical protein